MGGASSRRKGHQFERDIAIMLRDIFPGARRQLEYHEDDCKGVDILGTGHFKFQCKKTKNYVSVNTIKEIQFDPTFEVPILVTAADRKESMAILPLCDLLNLIRMSQK